ncbi:MAG: DUF4384 domain-containing protein [Candidatus Krumholzibacteriia bacterium]
MKKALALVPVLALILALDSEAVTRYNSTDFSSGGVSVTLADPSGSVYQQGESVSFTVRSDADAYVLVFDIDTEGFVTLLYPRTGHSLPKLSPGEELRIPNGAGESLRISGMTGMEFVFALSVPDRDAIAGREVASLLEGESAPFHKRFRVDGDPFLAANRVAEKLVRGVRYSEGVSLAYTYFYVDEAVGFPRYLCEECFASGEDPYGPGAPSYHAAAAFDNEDHLSFPLSAGFERQFAENPAKPDGYDDGNETEGTVNRVYVSYDPDSYYGYDSYPWYAGFGYYPYYGLGYYPYYGYGHYPYNYGFYWGIGFSFGDYYGYPYYYGGAYPYYYGNYGNYGYYRHGGESISSRSLRLQGKVKYKSALQAGMNQRNAQRGKYKATTAWNGSGKVKSRSSSPVLQTRRAARSKYGADRTKSRPVKKVARHRGTRSFKQGRAYTSRNSRRAASYFWRGKSSRTHRGRTAVRKAHSNHRGRPAPRVKSRSTRGHSGSKGTRVRGSRTHSRPSGRSSSPKSSRGGGKRGKVKRR